MIRHEKATGLGTIAAEKMQVRMNWSSDILKNDPSTARKHIEEMDPLFPVILEGLGGRIHLIASSLLLIHD